MKKRLREIAIVCLLGGFAAGGFAGWMYYRARARAETGMTLLKKSFAVYDESDAFKGTPEENKLIEEGQRYEQVGNETLSAARKERQWAMISGIASLALLLTSIAAIVLHLRRKESESP